MNKFEIKTEDFVTFINSFGYKVGDSYIDFEFNPLTDILLNSNKMFEITINKGTRHTLIKVKINERELIIDNKDLSKFWRKHLHNIYGQEYYDYLKNYCEKNKNFYKKLHEENVKELDDKIAKLIEEKNIRIAKNKELNEKYDAILNDLEENLEM